MLLYTIDCCLSIFTFQSSIIKVQNFLITLTCFSDSTHRHECFDLGKNIGVKRFNFILSSCIGTVYPRTYTQIHTPTVVQGGRGVWMELLPGVFDILEYLKRFYLYWKTFDLLGKMRYILGVLALLEACDVTNNSRHLGFYQELEIRLKPREMIFFSFTWKITHKKALCMILVTRFTLIVERSWKNMYFPLKLSWPPLLMTSYLVTIATDHH